MTDPATTHEPIVRALLDVLPADRFLDRDPDVMEAYSHDEGVWAPYGKPAVVVRPRSTEEVRQIVLACIETGTPSCRALPARGWWAVRTPSTAAWSWSSTR
ncbi:hypothetical protein [Mobilicoccus caccae]|uniref:FAD binding domain-containing protein n=1 Tax=Mobilicoccus caccae TaxID=1859295 RepID=A0ABQ6IXP3_9MICO|nr:hypothetical protein [Mobilicoccus caccae]GMA42088.1 hypothetical protein GCM10025883_41330 [Mobilicoccus caccae]